MSDAGDHVTVPTHDLENLYSSLRLDNEGDIRLVSVHRNQEKALICELGKANLRDGPEYLSISYTWGPSTDKEASEGVSSLPSHNVKVNGQDVLVTQNLVHFLGRAADDSDLRLGWMWIDSLCINQADEIERTEQVKLMADIYRSARDTIIWLGPGDEFTENAFGLIRCLAKLSKAELKRVTPRAIGSEDMLQLLHPCGAIDSWTALTKLFERKYFTRIWIVQEIMLSSRKIAVCGEHSIHWDDVVSEFLAVSAWTRWICPGDISVSLEKLASHHAIPNLIEAIKHTRNTDDSRLMMYSLIRARRFESSNPRDKVYALLGIAGPSTAGKIKYEPVYQDRSVAETYTLTAMQLLEDSDDLLVLAHAEGDAFRNIPGLPTWVPDWSCAKVLGLGVTGYARYSACGSLPRSLDMDEERRRLHVRGKRIDHVVCMAETKEAMLREEPLPRLLNMICQIPQVYHTGQKRLEVFWRVLITDTAGSPVVHPAPANYGNAFSKWFPLHMFKTRNRVSDSLTSRAFKALGLLKLSSAENIVEGRQRDPPGKVHAQDYEAAFSHASHLRPFLTSKSYLGLGSESVIEGDSVWIVAGSRVPLILRDLTNGRHEVVGGAYLHGFMHGEGIGDGVFEEIVLV